MPSSATDLLRLQKMATGEKVNTWGSEMNDTVIELVEDAIAGWETITVTGNVTLTSTNYVADQARKSMINLTGTPASGFNVTIPGSSKWYWFRNATGQTATITAGGATCEVYDGEIIGVLTDGTDCYRVERNAFAQELDMKSNKIVNVDTPTASGDAVNKAYADTVITTAQTHATNAANSATAAAASASAASTSETNAATSETNAAASASAASTSATNASTSETNAAASASAASTSETNAAASATAAAASATAASTSETNAASSASAASTSATNAATSETNAATSESNASTSASNAATSETNAAASYDSFDDRYLGAKASDPTLDNDGDALLTGALYWNTTDNTFRAYSGSAWEIFGTGAVSTLDEIAEANLDAALQAKVNRSAPNKFDATTAPTANWDSADTAAVGTAFAEGSVVIDTVANEAYRCVDATATAAIWINTTLTTSELGTIATQNANAVAITGGSISGITDLAVADGGTGASTAAAARTNLGLAIGTDVLAYNAYANAMNQGVATTDSPTFAGLTVSGASANFSAAAFDFEFGGTPFWSLRSTGVSIYAPTADASDNQSLILAGGGSENQFRGGWLELRGNEHATNPGQARLSAGINTNVVLGTFGTGQFVFEQDGSAVVTINSDGEVGVNETNPQALVHASAATGTELLRLYDSTVGTHLAVDTYDNGGGVRGVTFAVSNDGSAATDILYLRSTGIGIGEDNPLHTVHVSGSGAELMVQSTGATNAKVLIKGNSGIWELRNYQTYTWSARNSTAPTHYEDVDTLIWRSVAAIEAMRLDAANKRVGINETIPDYTLDVNGDFGFTPGTSVTPTDNGDVVFELTNNTTFTVKAKGTDGTVRSGTVTLA